MNVFLYYKTLTIRLDNIVAIIFQKNYQFALSGPWQVFAVATIIMNNNRKIKNVKIELVI